MAWISSPQEEPSPAASQSTSAHVEAAGEVLSATAASVYTQHRLDASTKMRACSPILGQGPMAELSYIEPTAVHTSGTDQHSLAPLQP